MAAVAEPGSSPLPRLPMASARWLVTLALLLFAWTHRHAFDLVGFADDLGLLSDLSTRATSGELLSDALGKWSAPLWPGSAMWRPWAFDSFALDAAVWGYRPGGWLLTNLLLHLASASLTGLLTARLLAQRVAAPVDAFALSGAAAFAVVLLAPWSPEVTLWLVGRFDGWAAATMLLALWAGVRSRGPDRWFALSLAAAAIAHASKESALLLPLWFLLTALAQRVGTGRPSTPPSDPAWPGWLILAQIALATAIGAWRASVLGGAAATVYGQSATTSAPEFFSRLIAHAGFFHGLVPLAPAGATVAVLGVVAMLIVATWRARAVAALGVAMAASVLAALALYFAQPPGTHDGYRLYYMAGIGVALAIGAGVPGAGIGRFAWLRRWLTIGPLLATVIALAVWQARVASEWTRASLALAHAQDAVRATLATLPAQDYGLLLLPDASGRVPTLRNAQGVLLPPVLGGRRLLDHLVIFTPPQFAEWQRLAGEDVVPKLTPRADAPKRPTRYFCHAMNSGSLIDLGYWPPAPADWETRWRQAATQAGCSL